MPKNSESPKEPQRSKLPIKTDDSPLVIDLPDGQKIVLGKLPNGAVVEVATWRGTGRPDSRTNRIMLGMSNAPTDNFSTPEESSNGKRKFTRIKLPKLNFPAVLKNRVKKFFSSKPEEETLDIDIDAWISRLSTETKARNARQPQVAGRSSKPKANAKKASSKKATSPRKKAHKRG